MQSVSKRTKFMSDKKSLSWFIADRLISYAALIKDTRFALLSQ